MNRTTNHTRDRRPTVAGRYAPAALTLLTLLALALTAAPVSAGNVRAGYAQVDPGLDANVSLGDIELAAGLDSGSGFALGLEAGNGRLGFGLELTQSNHDIEARASSGGESIDLGGLVDADIYSALLAVRYRVNPESNLVFSVAALGGAIGYLDFEEPDGGTSDGGTTAFGAEAALDIFISGGWFVRAGYRFLEADIDLDDLDSELADQLRDNPFEPSIIVVQVGYAFGGQGR